MPSLIDLDRAPGVTPSPASARKRWPWLRAGLVAAVLITLAADAPALRGLDQVLTISGPPTAGFRLGPDALYTAVFSPVPAIETTVTRYNLTGGSRWTTTVPVLTSDLVLDPAGNTLLVRDSSASRLIFLDTAAGTIRWQRTEPLLDLLTMTADRVLLRTGSNGTLTLADLRTGAPIWRHTVAPTTEVHPDETAGRIEVVTPDNQATTLRFADGSVLGRGIPTVRPEPAHAPTGAMDLHPDTERLGQTWILTPNPTGPGRRALGPVTVGSTDTCSSSTPYFACQTTSGPLTVWRLPASG
ncbi:outer membrane protein assembly factor BamB family protein [Winogradskya humida]|uniref:Pyrrolo-quinoline quinone repeat domain-containing protein n=1 Tax=Winogradskya humida TaxID=113566 RepID=A0ABQ4A283_9ACTN|nr:PQQ-binding-like beta-propeller repeat protein [Actinoplanes humidus]GIE24964.1 hypothetical protein Ahu01nite_080660 [Actinoplanes humidus]